MEQKTFNITGMSCTHCSAKIEKSVGAQLGVRKAKIDFDKKQLTVKFNEKLTATTQIIQLITELGYGAVEC